VKLTARRLLILGGILILSIGFGLGFDAVATAIDKKNHPMPDTLSASVERYADEFGVPETVLWATVKEQSDFSSNLVGEDGRVGLMQISPELYERVCREILSEESLDHGILYDPETNLRTGAAYLSWLYQRYGVWDTVFAAYHAGIDPVDTWLKTPEYVNAQGRLENIPQKETQEYVKQMNKSVRTYSELYYE
jgi:soluble lytic murein transglycosylase